MTNETTETKGLGWKEYFDQHPDFCKLSPKPWDSRDGSMTRFYFGDFYLQRKMVLGARGSSYYDQHRIAKSDTSYVVSDDVTWHGDATSLAEIQTAAGPCSMDELYQRLVALTSRPKSRRLALRTK